MNCHVNSNSVTSGLEDPVVEECVDSEVPARVVADVSNQVADRGPIETVINETDGSTVGEIGGIDRTEVREGENVLGII